MRILHVIASGRRRGAEVFAGDLVAALASLGVPQRVVVLHESGPVADAFDVPVSVLSAGARGIPGLNVSVPAMLALRREIRGWPADLVQAHGGECMKYAAMAAMGTRARIVYRRIGGVQPWIPPGVRRVAYAALIRRADLVIAVADVIRLETQSAFGVRGDRILTIPNGVDTNRLRTAGDRQATRASLGIDPEAPVLSSVGALSWEKDPYGHVRIAARALTAVPDAVYLVAGGGPLHDEVASAVTRLGMARRIRLLGDRADVWDLLRASDVFLLASLTEGMPACVIEAGLAGLPVVSYDVGGVAEVVLSGVTGTLVAPGDEDRIALVVADLLGDEERRTEMGRAAAAHCGARYDTSTLARRYLDAYGEVLARTGGGPALPAPGDPRSVAGRIIRDP